MAVLTKTKVKPRVRVDEDEETETKAEPKPIVEKGLGGLVKQWDDNIKKGESYWARIVEYVADNEVSRKDLKAALIEIRGLAPMTADNECSKILTGAKEENREHLESLLAGDITVRKFRELITTPQEGKDEPETKFHKAMKKVATQAITELNMVELSDFVAAAKQDYRTAYAKVEAKQKREEEAQAAKDNGEQDEDSEE